MAQPVEHKTLGLVNLETRRIDVTHALALLHFKKLIELGLNLSDIGPATRGVFISALMVLESKFNFPELDSMVTQYEDAVMIDKDN